MSTADVTEVVSFPKSGRTWIEIMTAHAQSQVTGLPIRSFLAGHLDTQRIRSGGHPLIEFSHGRDKRLITSGGGFPVETYRGTRVALIVRDPRDVLVSQYNYEAHQHGRFDGSLDEFARFETHDARTPTEAARYGLGPILNWMNAWARYRDILAGFHITRYESMHDDPHQHLAALLSFAGVDATERDIADSVSYGSFENMRRLELTNELQWYGLPGADRVDGLKTRMGRTGAGRHEIRPESLSILDARIDAELDPVFSVYQSG